MRIGMFYFLYWIEGGLLDFLQFIYEFFSLDYLFILFLFTLLLRLGGSLPFDDAFLLLRVGGTPFLCAPKHKTKRNTPPKKKRGPKKKTNKGKKKREKSTCPMRERGTEQKR